MSEYWHAIEASDAARRLGWVLLHSVWLGSAAAGLLAAAEGVMRRRSANARYAAGCAALLAVMAASASAYFFVPRNGGPASAGVESRAGERHTDAPRAGSEAGDVPREVT